MTENWLGILEDEDYCWEDRPPPATEQEISALAQFVGRPLPEDYVAFLRRYNGGALWYRDIWYLHLWRAADIPSWSTAYGFRPTKIAGAVAIGSDGGGEGLVFDARPQQKDGDYPIFAINFVSIHWDEALAVAPNFRSLLLLHHEFLGP